VIVLIVIGLVLKKQVGNYAVSEANDKLNDILLNQKALHVYVEDTLKPVIYELKERNKLYKDFFDPRILSFTYISRNVREIENFIRGKNGSVEIYFKLASINPRNPINKANKEEKKLIEMFNKNRNLNEQKSIYEKDGKKYLLFSQPLVANKKSCMRCHSTPDVAPKELVEMYGDKAGFGEKIGQIRAIMTIRMPLEKAINDAYQYYFKIYFFVAVSLIILYVIFFYMFRKIDVKNIALEKLNRIDILTKVYNRKAYNEDIDKAIEEFYRYNRMFSLIMFDIDHFKKINDKYGHQKGDEILIKVCEIVSDIIRKSDSLYRVGGEEFIIICKNCIKKDAYELAQRIRKRVENYDFGLKVTISLGVEEFSEGMDSNKIYKSVDDLLYEAKNSGRNRVVAK
jgi:diguanylate cyclase (GGDEF)-like protein